VKKTLLSISLFIFLLFPLAACSNSAENKTKEKENITLTVSAAASLQNTLTTIQELYKKEHPEVTLTFNFGASGALQQQISQGAPVDLFFSAAEDKLDLLVEEGIIDTQDQVDLFKNNLVLITNKAANSSIQNFSDLTNLDEDKKIAIGIPESVPAGKYGKEALQSLDIWSKVEEKFVFAKDVRQVLSYVETNNVEAGIVYGTDALVSDKVQVVDTADASTHTPIIYPLGIINSSKHYKEAKQLYDFLQSEEVLKVYEKDGFIIN
jgi:molybdate transport system substrate-binding protein